MTKISEALTYGLTIRESANDGSDFTNPAADYRRLFLGEDGALHLRDSAGTVTEVAAAAAGAGWSLDVNESGASFANFTAATGTWSSNGTEIIQTDTGASWRRAKHNTLIPLGFGWIIEAEVYSATGGGTNRIGLGVSDGANQGGFAATIDTGTAQAVYVDIDNVIAMRTFNHAFSTSTWYKLRLVNAGLWLSCYIDDVLHFNMPMVRTSTPTLDDDAEFVTLLSNGANVKFRNVKAWTLSSGAPA